MLQYKPITKTTSIGTAARHHGGIMLDRSNAEQQRREHTLQFYPPCNYSNIPPNIFIHLMEKPLKLF